MLPSPRLECVCVFQPGLLAQGSSRYCAFPPGGQWLHAVAVPLHSCGAAPEFNRLPLDWKNKMVRFCSTTGACGATMFYQTTIYRWSDRGLKVTVSFQNP